MNWARRGWSSTADRSYHDEVFKHAGYDPTDSAYPGSVTIRRFADLAARYISPGDIVVDLGCGPGEITCELARRFPVSRFIGVDHSATAIARAQALAQQLQLTNIRFTVEDLIDWVPAEPVHLVALFDAFHHVPNPEATIARLGAHTDRFFLIEPAGNWYGGWQQSVNLDWVAESLFLIRDRLAAQLAPVAPTPPGPSTMPLTGEPVERRYPLEDFERMFAGYGLDIQGTAAGIERYGTQPEAISPLRRDVGDLTYRMFVELDTLLDRRGTVVIPDGPRTPWPRAVPPGTSCAVYLTVHLPAVPGRYTVLVDGVHEGVTWFSQAGVPPLLFSVEVTPP
ncbi:MAG: methyltransferase domain-containing protein [Acidobacteria bacterium]|nr:methyltransferase domain-containing protein [Acidobacteriota bacterium]